MHSDRIDRDRRRHTFSKLPTRTSPSPSPSQSSSPSPSGSSLPGQRRHVFGGVSGSNRPQESTRAVTGVHAAPPAGPVTAGSSVGSVVNNPLVSGSPTSSTTNETAATGSHGAAGFTSFNPVARAELAQHHGTPTAHCMEVVHSVVRFTVAVKSLDGSLSWDLQCLGVS